MYQDIRAALVTHYQGLGLALPVQWENTESINDEQFIKFDFIPNVNGAATLGTNGADRHQGLLQLLIKKPIEAGPGDSLTLASTIVEHFKRGSVVSYNGVSVKIKNATAGGAYPSADKYITPITITWQSDIQR